MKKAEVPQAIEWRGIKQKFGAVEALRGVSCSISQGEIVALLGANGAGKTTLVDIGVGLQTPNAGSASILGMSPRKAIERSLVGVVSQAGGLTSDLTVEGTLKLFRSFHERALPLTDLLREANLEELRKRPVGKLSGGEKQRVRLALALLPNPLVLILDEPTTGMDATARQEFWEVMHGEAARGRTVIFATHYLAEAEQFAERTIIMKQGRVVADAPTEELRSRSNVHLSALVPQSVQRAVSADLAAVAADDWKIVWRDNSVTIAGHNTDSAARTLLTHPGVHSLRIAESSLEEVFTEMMKESDAA